MLCKANSVVKALSRNRVIDYWPKAGEYGELKDYVLNDIDGVREAVVHDTESPLKAYNDEEELSGSVKLSEQPRTTGRILLVGIGYYRKDKTHHCRIEVL